LSAAKNLVDLSPCLPVAKLGQDDVDWIAGNVVRLFADKTDFNEFVRMCAGIPGDLKLWLIVP
jgi:hypothetical protein